MRASNRSAMPTLRQVLARGHMRLIFVAVLTAAITLMVTGVLVIRGYADRNLALIARTVAYTVEPALVFEDRDAAQRGIVAVAASESVHHVAVRDTRGRTLVEWRRPAEGAMATVERGIADLIAPSPALADIRRGPAVIAQVQIYGGADGLGRFILSGLATALACLVLTLIATWTLSRRLQRDVTEPLGRIADVAHAVRADRQFDRRVPTSDIQEVDQLGRDFNALLDELHDWHKGVVTHNRMLERQATRDVLTGLGNRAMFEQLLPAAVAQSDAQARSFAILYIDVNRFKQVNDTHGHDAGDALLIVIAARLRAVLRPEDEAFRLGGDEFALILAPGLSADQLAAIKARIADGMAQPIMLPNGERVDASLSIGSACYPEDSADARDLLRHADAAMYAAKAGRAIHRDR
ncbi:diguanylate cyclase [Sphingobium sp. 3R8]|uniref:diguanylate cyclase domain-containing protein n=1 Tax=Sphingobium sp. 3R8 TaxID=2874921 RepID=UPI001CCEE7BA|nr:diguanylate cyclase [Sphingobium sp. 3R8]MBZ9647309.1 diguanylate cyclase [Sphingobium sp. 3R8]